MIEVYRSAELVNATVRVPVRGDKRLHVPIYSVLVGGLVVGDVVEVLGQWEVTNDLGYNVMVGQYVTAWSEKLNHAMTENLTPAQHHMARFFHVVADRGFTDDVFFEFVLYAAASKAKAGAKLKVEDYGHMTVVVHKPA